MREFTVSINDENQRLDRFLMKAVPKLSMTLRGKYIRLKRIKVNGKRTDAKYRLVLGDVIQLYINDEYFTDDPGVEREIFARIKEPELDIVFEDEHLLILNKAPGVLCHSGNEVGAVTLIDHVKAYLVQTKQWDPLTEHSFVPALSNRLDRNTGGLVISCKTAAALQVMNEKIRLHEVSKYYLLAVHGRPNPQQGRLLEHFVKDQNENKVYAATAGDAGAKEALTEYRTLQTTDDLSLVECQIITGRTHQIRVQMAGIGCPLLGDAKYGSGVKSAIRARHQALWAHRLVFDFTRDAGVLNHLKGRAFRSDAVPFLRYFG